MMLGFNLENLVGVNYTHGSDCSSLITNESKHLFVGLHDWYKGVSL
jgi:hypothetical protein